jgi:antitoxin (DNA-binding transcriptional repressor) of toxin-antitoxin stability system
MKSRGPVIQRGKAAIKGHARIRDRRIRMSATVTLQEAQAYLPELVRKLSRGEEVAITEGDQVVARIVGEGPAAGKRPGPGLCKGMITIVSDDDEHLKDFAEYMP